jgi:hypothetical protein
MDKKLKIFTIFASTKAWLISILCLVSLEISHASPIEFWLTGQESFNNKEECSIYPVCFCQTINPSDTLRLDIRDSTDGTNYLVIYRDDGSIWKNYTFSATGFDHHQYLLIVGESGDWDDVEDRKLIFKISNTSIAAIIAPTSWSNSAGLGSAFTKSATQFTASTSGIGGTTFAAKESLSLIPSGTRVIFNLTILGGGSWSGFVTVKFWNGDPDSGGIGVGTQSFTGLVSGITYNETVDLTLTGNATYVSISTNLPNTGSAENIAITVIFSQPIQVIYVSDSAVLAFSDCVEITDNQDFICTKLISYSNSTDIAGLGFPSWSPPAIYYLRIPAVFFEEQYPQEQEDLELSTDEIITLWSKMEAKKLLDIGFMPFYMHKKVQLILMMDYISIDGIEYRKRDPYTISEGGSKRHALRRAQVLLSEKDFITRNLL